MPKQQADKRNLRLVATRETRTSDSETEDDLGSVDPSLLGNSVVTGTDWTAGTIIDQLHRKNISLDPDFQRRDAWNLKRKSRFIESIVLGLPIPQIVLAELPNAKGTFLVIDGKQRLLTLQQFAGLELGENQSPLLLKGLRVRRELNGKSLLDLRNNPGLRDHLSAFENQSIRTVVVRNWRNEKVLYIIFHRLNSSSVPLSPQELRQALHPGKFVKFAGDYSETSKGLQRALNLKGPDFRMRDVELLIRFFAYINFADRYRGNLKDFLDFACIELNKRWKEKRVEIEGQAADLESAIRTSFKVFGKGAAFRKWDGTRFETRFNRPVFDIMTYYFSQPDVRRRAIVSADRLKPAFQRLCEDDANFRRALETTTKSLDANMSRFSAWGSTLQRLLGIEVSVPNFRNNGK